MPAKFSRGTCAPTRVKPTPIVERRNDSGRPQHRRRTSRESCNLDFCASMLLCPHLLRGSMIGGNSPKMIWNDACNHYRAGARKMNRWIGIVASVLIASALVLLLYVGPATGGVDQFRTKLLSYGPWAVVVSAGLMIAQAIIAPLPANVVTITNGLVFGPLWGALLSWVCTLVGASLCFMLSRTFGKPFALRIVGKPLDNAERFFKKYGLHAMFVVRIVPFVPFDAISYGAGLIGVPYLTFLT